MKREKAVPPHYSDCLISLPLNQCSCLQICMQARLVEMNGLVNPKLTWYDSHIRDCKLQGTCGAICWVEKLFYP